MDLLKDYKIIVKFCFYLCIIVFLCACNSTDKTQNLTFYLPNGSDCIEVINADSLTIDSPYMFRAIYDSHPALIIDEYVTILDDTLSAPMHFPFKYSITDIHWNEGRCFFASDSIVYYGETNGIAYPIVKSSKVINSFTVSDEHILFSVDSLLLKYTFGEPEVGCYFNAPRTISHFTELQSSVFLSAGSDMFLLFDDTAYHIFDAKEDITAFAVLPSGGLFLGTLTKLMFISPNYTLIDIIKAPISKLELIGDDLYVIFINNNSIKLTNVSNYQILLCAKGNNN